MRAIPERMALWAIVVIACGELCAANSYSYDPDDAKTYIVTVPEGETNTLDAAAISVITGGTVQVVATGIKGLSSPKGVKADGDFTISGGSFYSYSAAAAPLEAASQTIATGYTTLESKPRRLIIEY